MNRLRLTRVFHALLIVLLGSGLIGSLQPRVALADFSIELFDASPGSPVAVGTHVSLHGRSRGDVRAVRFEVNGQPKAEIGSHEQWETWKTEEFGPGTYNVCFVVAGGSNAIWENAIRSCKSYEVTGTVSSANPGGDPGGSSGGSPTSSDFSIEFFNVSPGSPVVVGTDVTLHGRSQGAVRAVRFEVDGHARDEIGQPEQSATWRTAEAGVGGHTVCFAVAGGSNATWDNARRACTSFEVRSPDSGAGGGGDSNGGGGSGGDSTGGDEPSTVSVPVSQEPVQQPARLDYGATGPVGDRSLRVIASNGLNIRGGPGTNYPIIGRSVFGGYFEITGGPDGNWYKIRFNNGEGWVSAQWVELHLSNQGTANPDSSTPSTPPEPSVESGETPESGNVIDDARTVVNRVYGLYEGVEFAIDVIDGKATLVDAFCTAGGLLLSRDENPIVNSLLESTDTKCVWLGASSGLLAGNPIGFVPVLLYPEKYVDPWLDRINAWATSYPLTCTFFPDAMICGH